MQEHALTSHHKSDSMPLWRQMIGPQTLMLVLIMGVLPNLIFVLASPVYLAERLISPLLYIAAGYAMLLGPRWFGWSAIFLALAIDFMLMIMFAFHLPPDVAIDSVRYLVSIDVTASLFYVALVTIMVLVALSFGWLIRKHDKALRAASPIPLVVFAYLLMAYDWAYTFPYFSKSDQPFESALGQSGMDTPAIARRGNNLLIVMVEGMGAYADPAHRDVLQSILQDSTGRRYELETGTTNYVGSTTGAASRELCDQWGDYLTYLDGRPHDCLPAKLSRSGYDTIAYHGFDSDMFKRDQWYPDIGFGELNFMGDMAEDQPTRFEKRCGSVFKGLCDQDVAGLVHERLLEESPNPKLIYWLTLNSHVPYVPMRNGPLGCQTSAARIENRQVCELTEFWVSVFSNVGQIADDPDLPPTDILIVGDHHTPLWQRAAKNHFILNKVDWYLLRDRRMRGSEQQASAE